MQWVTLFRGRDLLQCRVAVQFWRRIKRWAVTHFPLLLTTLNPGLTAEEVERLEAWLGRRLPDTLAALYLLHNGQRDPWPQRNWHEALAAPHGPPVIGDSCTAGLFGMYRFYSHAPCSFLLPAQSGAWFTVTAAKLGLSLGVVPSRAPRGGPDAGEPSEAGVPRSAREYDAAMAFIERAKSCAAPPERFCFAASSIPQCEKGLFVGLPGGQVSALDSRNGHIPIARDASHRGPAPGEPQLADWLTTYVDRLEGGTYAVEPVMEPRKWRAISLQPAAPPLLAESVTNGIRVRASFVHVPELSTRMGEWMFAYQITFDHVLAAGAPVPEGMVAQAQLVEREWRIHNEMGERVDTVLGEGVVGEFPIVSPGCKPFKYTSCSLCTVGGFMDGTFFFVPGTIDAPASDAVIAVACPTMRFDMPDFTY